MGRKGGRVVRNMYKGHMDKTRGGRITVRSGDGWGGGGSGWGKMETTVLEQQLKKRFWKLIEVMLHNNMNILKANELYIWKRLK